MYHVPVSVRLSRYVYTDKSNNVFMKPNTKGIQCLCLPPAVLFADVSCVDGLPPLSRRESMTGVGVPRDCDLGAAV